jgi:G patch domain-containing protein 1
VSSEKVEAALERREPSDHQDGHQHGHGHSHGVASSHEVEHSPPPQYPVSEASSSSPRPPPFSSLFSAVETADRSRKAHPAPEEATASGSVAAPAYSYCDTPATPFDPDQGTSSVFQDPVAETKRALPSDTKAESSGKDDDAEPPPAYSEGDSPLESFSYVMAAAGGTSSIITQVQQGGPPINALGGESAACLRII